MKLPTAIVNNPSGIAVQTAPATDIGALVSARNLAEREAHNRAEHAARDRKAKAADKVSRRDDRVSVVRSEDCLRVSIAPKFMSDMLKEQLGWGFCFAFVNPGVFIMMPIAALLHMTSMSTGLIVLSTVCIWSVLLTMANVVFALCARRRLTLDMMTNGYYSLYSRNAKRPILFGKVPALNVDIDEPDAHRLGQTRFKDEHGCVDAELLTPRDLDTLRRVLFP